MGGAEGRHEGTFPLGKPGGSRHTGRRMHTLNQMARALNRSSRELSRLQSTFELPVFPGAGYSEAYLAFLRTIVRLRTLQVKEEMLRDLWNLERKLLKLLHADAGGSPTWFLDACGTKAPGRHRLLLSQRDVGAAFDEKTVQPGLDLAPEQSGELFPGAAMGEDLMRLLDDYRRLHGEVRKSVRTALPLVDATVAWGKRKFRALPRRHRETSRTD